jgi:hypothetical protein
VYEINEHPQGAGVVGLNAFHVLIRASNKL